MERPVLDQAMSLEDHIALALGCARSGDRAGVLRAIRSAGPLREGVVESLRQAPDLAPLRGDVSVGVLLDRYGNVSHFRARFREMLAGRGPPDELVRALDVAPELWPLSTRELQVYAALCLTRFCAARAISHPNIDELVAHLASILTAVDLPAWEQRGAGLALSGRGDPLPAQLEARIPAPIREPFRRLVHSAVEVGLANMYSASTETPWVRCDDVVRQVLEATSGLPEIPRMFGHKVLRGLELEEPSSAAELESAMRQVSSQR